MEPWNTFPKNYRYRLSPASEVYHKAQERHPLAFTVASAVFLVAILFIGTIICDLLGWPA